MNVARGRRWITWSLGALVAAGYLLHTAAFWPQVNDDAYITFRYAKFLALGRGPYFNPGEHVEGYTNFLMVPLCATAWLLGGDEAVPLFAKALGVAAGLAAVAACASLCRELLRGALGEEQAGAATALGWIAAALVAVNSAFALNSTTGLETTLFAALITAGMAVLANPRRPQRFPWAGVCFAGAALARPEGAAVFGIAALATAGTILISGKDPADRHRLRRLGGDALIVAIVVAAHVLFRYWAYDGQWLPNTYYAKTGGMPERTAQGYLLGFAKAHLAAGHPAAAVLRLLVPACAPLLMWAAALERRRRALVAVETASRQTPAAARAKDGAAQRAHGLEAASASAATTGHVATMDWRAAAPPVAVLLFAAASVFATGPDWMPGFRLLVPYIPVWSVLLVVSLAAAVALFARRAAVVTGMLGIAVVCGLSWAQWPALTKDRADCLLRARGYAEGHEALARWLHGSTTAGQTVALMDIGIVGYRNVDLRILDITGLTDRFIARAPGPFLGKEFDPAYVFDQGPDILVIILHAAFEPDGTEDWSRLKPFTKIEERLLVHGAFGARYARMREPAPHADELTRLACLTGAERVFRHRYPGYAYYLAAFRRQD